MADTVLNDEKFYYTIREVAQTIGVSVCVEGIETPEQFKVLQGMKVTYIQGYYFSKPVTVEEFYCLPLVKDN